MAISNDTTETNRYDLDQVRVTGVRSSYPNWQMRRLLLGYRPAPWYRRLLRWVQRWVATH